MKLVEKIKKRQEELRDQEIEKIYAELLKFIEENATSELLQRGSVCLTGGDHEDHLINKVRKYNSQISKKLKKDGFRFGEWKPQAVEIFW